MKWGSCPGGFTIQWGKEMKNIKQKSPIIKEFLWDVQGAQKTFSVSDSACGSSIIPCLFFDVLSFIKILQSIYTKQHHVIWSLSRKQAAARAQYLGLCYLIRKGLELSAQSKRNYFLLRWWRYNNTLSPLLPHQPPTRALLSFTPSSLVTCMSLLPSFEFSCFSLFWIRRCLPWIMQRFLVNSCHLSFLFNNVS